MDDRLDRFRADAVKRVELYQSRYHEGGNRDQYISIAQRWSDALHREELDPNEMSDVIRDAEQYRFQADIAFFGFINHMRGAYTWLWEQYLTRGGAGGEGESPDR
jgi:hypothetical protein